MANLFTEKNIRGNQGGHQGLIGFQIDEIELKGLIKSIEKLGMSDSQTKVKLRQGMRKAAKPLVNTLRDEIKKVEGKDTVDNKNRATGRLQKSIAVINGKMRRGVAPAVYVGPRVKGAYADKKRSGFHFYFLEYGFRGKPGARMLDKVYASGTAKTALNNVISEIKKEVERLWSKRMK
tara:strand:+ start:1562 stop:2095 length:534 start_codon:yes stop_codon:yes gene_type:complete